jgi:integrase
MTPRKILTDRAIKAAKPAKAGERNQIADGIVPGLFLRVTDKGAKSFVLVKRYPGSINPTRRALGTYGAITLDDARTKARDWLALLQQGIDPAEQEARQRAEEQRKRLNSFASIAEDFIREKLPTERSGKEIERIIRTDLLPRWGNLPVTGISDSHVRDLVAHKKQVDDAPAMAGNLLALTKRLFRWGLDRGAYGLERVPGDRLKRTNLVGKAVERARFLENGELRAFWNATGQMGYPYGDAYRILLLTGLRRNEVCEAQWGEIDFDQKHWTIPAERMKGNRKHLVPLSDDLLDLLQGIRDHYKGKAGEFVFSQSDGVRPIARFSAEKKTLDKAMKKQLGGKLKPFVIHDLRRTMRTGLGSFANISDKVKELVIAHKQPGVNRVYDLYEYRDEKLEALDQWARKLRGLVAGDSSNVVTLRA